MCTYATIKMEGKGHDMHSIIGNQKLTLMELESYQWVFNNFSNENSKNNIFPIFRRMLLICNNCICPNS